MPAILPTKAYGIQLVSPNLLQIAASGVDTVILEVSSGYAEIDAADVAFLHSNGIKVLAYISVGETDHAREYWDPAWTTDGTDTGDLTGAAPSWLGPRLLNFPSRLVDYSDPAWYTTALVPQLLKIKANGFDGVFLDNVQSFYNWTDKNTWSAADRAAFAAKNATTTTSTMLDTIEWVGDQFASSDYVVQNGGADLWQNLGWLHPGATGAQMQADLLAAISAVMTESLYWQPDGTFAPNQYAIDSLKAAYVDHGVPVLSLDYVSDRSVTVIADYIQRAVADGFWPFAASSDAGLSGWSGARNLPTAGMDGIFGGPSMGLVRLLGGDDLFVGHGGRDVALGEAGSDTLRGGFGNDRLAGGRGDDSISGEAGRDLIEGGTGADGLYGGGADDTLDGGAGADRLNGGAGGDEFRFAPGAGRDIVLDFDVALDRIRFAGLGLSAADVIATDRGTDTLLRLGDVTLVLKGFDAADVGAIDMVFV
jgi:endo-alpha-1,4-polygalactosaminidase (GH114 family)